MPVLAASVRPAEVPGTPCSRPFSVRYFSARAAQDLLRMFGGSEYIRDNKELTAMARSIEGAYSCGKMFVLDHKVRQTVR